MSTTLSTEARWYRVGAVYGLDGSLGFDSFPLVGRFKFRSPSTGATELRFASEAYAVYGGSYNYNDPGFHFLVTAESTGYESRVGADLGSPTVKSYDSATGKSSMTGSVSVLLTPNADYYLWIWPDSRLVSRIEPGAVTVTVEGVYGTPSTVSAADGCFGAQVPVTLGVSTPGALHTLSVSCAGRTEQLLLDSGAESCVWTPELETYARLLPDRDSAEAVFTCVTKFGGNTVGATTKSVTVRFAAGSLSPTLTAGWAVAAPCNTGSAAAGLSVYVQGHSRAELSFDSTKVSFKSGASLAGFRIRCNGVTVDASPYRTNVLTGSAEILCTVIDSRGQEASETLQVPVQPYADPRLTEVTVFRCDSMGDPADDGQYYSAKGKALFSSLGGENSVTLTVAHKQTDETSFGAETALQNDTASGVGFGKAPEHDNCLELPEGWVIRIGNRVVAGQ